MACQALHTTVIRLSLEQLAQPAAVKAVHSCGARVAVTVLGKEDNAGDIRRVIELGAALIETDRRPVSAPRAQFPFQASGLHNVDEIVTRI